MSSDGPLLKKESSEAEILKEKLDLIHENINAKQAVIDDIDSSIEVLNGRLQVANEETE